MRAVEIQSPGVTKLVEKPDPVPGPGEVVLAIGACGICGTDLRVLEGDYGHVEYPLVPGHEFAGHVVAVGAGVTKLREGDLAAADPNLSCYHCEWCDRGAVNLCANWVALGVTTDGAMAEMVVVPERFAVKLPDGMDVGVGALIEPLSCVLHAVERADLVGDRRLLIYGGGAIGLMFLAVAKLKGLHVSVIEPHALRREVAVSLGADAVAGSSAELDLGDGLDYVLDASGAPAAITDGITHLRKRGTYLQMGVAPSAARISISPYELYANEWRFIGSNSLERCYPEAAELMPELADKLATLITHRVPLAEFDQAVALMTSPDALKVHVIPTL